MRQFLGCQVQASLQVHPTLHTGVGNAEELVAEKMPYRTFHHYVTLE